MSVMRPIVELKRTELLDKMRREDPPKYQRRMNYQSFITTATDTGLFMRTGTVSQGIRVPSRTSGNEYLVQVHFASVMRNLSSEMKLRGMTRANNQVVYAALRKAVDDGDVAVDCSCPDFRYRHAYWATKGDYKYGEPETRPANIRNPDNKGAACKHTAAVLARPSKWIIVIARRLVPIINQYLESQEEKEPKDNDVEDDFSDVEMED